MLSKKNHQLQAQKLEAKQQHFAIKKLTVGVASVLISSTFAMYAGLHTAMADETTRPQAADTASETTATENETAKSKVVLKATTSSEDKTQTATAKSSSALTTASTDKAKSAVEAARADKDTATAESSSALTTASTDKAKSAVETAKADKGTATAESSSTLTTTSTDKAKSAVETAKADKGTTTAESTSTLTTATGKSANVAGKDLTATTMDDQVSKPKVNTSNEEQNTQSLVPSATVDPDGSKTNALSVKPEETPTSPQWQADASKAVANKSGLYTPQMSYNRKYYTMSVDPDMLTPEVMKGNVIPFTATMHRSAGTMIMSSDYKLRLQLDARLADKVSSVSLSPASDENKFVYFTRVPGSGGQPTNIWEANVVYAQGGLYGGTPIDSGHPVLAKNGRITLKDTLENLYPKLPDIATEPLGYNGYVYDASSRTALMATNNEGYVVGPNDPLVKVPVTSASSSKFIGAHSNVNYDPTVGKNGALVVYYQAQKSEMWAYQNYWQFQLHYAIDPALLPYLEKKNNAYTVELDKSVAGLGLNDGSYGFEAITNNFLNNLYKPLTYRSKLMKKVADLPLNLDGTGTLNPSNLKDFVEFNNGLLVGGRPVMVRLVYRLNKKLNDIYTEMLKKGMTGNNLLFSHYYSDSTGKMQKHSLATSVLSFNDSDGDTLPNLKEESDSTDPYVSMPNVSNTYGAEKKVHGQLVFSNVERNTQVVKVVDDRGNVLGRTEVRPETFTTLAKAVPFEVALNQQTLTAGTQVTVQVSSKLNHSEDTVENAVPQRTVVQVKNGPKAVKGLTYPLNAVFLEEPKTLIANTAELPADATYTLVKKPDLSTNGTKNAVVKVSFPDQYDKNYDHEIEVQVPVKVEGVNLKDGEFTLKPLAMHVNEVNDDLRPLPVEELESWHETDGTKTLNGQSLRSLVKSVTWSQSPSTKKAGQARGVVTVTTKDDKTMLANVPVNIVGATARPDLKTPWGTELLAKDAVANTTALAQFDKADSPVTYKWKEPLNVTPPATADHVMHNAVVVTYGDKTTQEVPVSVTVGPSQASEFTVAPAKVEVHYGQTVDPEASLTPEQKTHFNVSQVTLEQPVVTTKLGQVNADGQVVFNDGSTASVEVPVVVVGATAKNDVTTAWNVLPTPQTLVSNVSSLAKYTPTYTWNKRPDVSPTKEESHVVSGVVDVTYPDKVVQHLPVTLTVLASQAERFDNATDKQVLPVVVAYGATDLDAMHALEPETKTNFGVTQATFTTPVDTATVGTKEVPATLTFADTSTTTLPVQVEVLGADVASKVETAWGKLPTAKDMVTNADELEQFGASYSWKNAPVVTPDAGEDHQVTGTLLVTYHNGATQTLPVSLTVKASEGERFANDQDVHLKEVSVNYGAKVPADKADNALTTEEKTNSKVTALVFKQDVDTLTAGEKLYPVQLSFNDGSKLDSQVLVKVVGAVAKQALTTPWGRNVAAKDLVANTSELDRFGTQEHPVTYQWVTSPNVTPEPEHTHTVTGTVTVTYGDGATQQLPVSFTVEPSDAEKATNELKNNNVVFTVNYGAKVDPTQALTAYSTETKNKTKLTTAKFNGPVETTELGMNAHSATLTFADGSTLAVELPVKVVGAQVDPTRKTAWGKVPDPSTVVTDLTELAKFDPKYTWKVQPVTTPLPDQDHHVQGTLQVEFADGATQTVPVELDVAPSMAEAAKDLQMQLVVEDLKASVPATDALKGLTEQDRQVYSVTQALFDHPVETNEVGAKSYEATLTFADGSTAKLPVQVKVVSQAENLAPVAKEGLNVSLGETLAPTDVLTPAVVLPKDTQLSWKTPVDTTKAGHQMGELEVTYPDGSKDVVEVPVKVGTDAEAMTPTVRPDLGVALNGELNPTDVLSSDLPKDTQLSWKTPVDTTKAGHQMGELEVTYPDGSKDVVEVPVKVGTDAEAMTPTVRPDLGVALNGELNPTDVLSSDLPKDTQLSWKTPVDTTKAGHQTGELEVTYPDGSKDVVEVPVKVGTDAEAMTPTVRPDLGVALNGELNPTDVLSSDLPKDTQLSWKTPVDTSKAGHQTGELEVTYPDGSKDVVEVPVKVGTDAEALTPTVRPDLGVALNGELKPADVLSSDLPKDTQLSWKTPVDTTKAGHQTGELEVTYPDGSKDVVEVPVKVGTDAEAMTPTVRPDLGVALNGELNPTDVLSSDLPKDTQLSWKTPVDTTKAGHQTGELEVTYPDGSKDVVKVPVKVGTDAEALTPTVRPDLGVALNGELKPADVLSSDLPKDTQLSWKTPVDTTKAGHQTGELEVTYPDGSKDVVKVPVKVGTDAEAMTPTVRPDLGVALNGELNPTDVLSSDLPKDTQLSWKTPVDTTKAGHQMGELEVTYPDGSKDVVEVPVKVGTDAEALTPTVRPDLGVALNGELNPTDVLSSDLPKETQLSWKTSVDTSKAGHQTGELEVTYPDGSKDVVEVPVKVGTDAEAMTPTVRPAVEVALNGELNPADVLSSDLPKDTQLSWKTPVDTTKAGHQTGELEVTYPDGSKDVVKVPVKVGTDAEAMTPTVRPAVEVALNGELNPTDVLSSNLPKDTQLSWKTPVDTTKAGHQTGELEVTYPDGSKDVVEVPVKVGTDAEALTPTVRPDLGVALNGELNPTDVLSSDLPKDTQLSWKTPVDTSKAGHQTGELEVTYPDGSKDGVEVPVKVGTDAEALTPTVRPDLGVALNGELNPTDVLSSDLPKETQLSWKTSVDTSKAGHQTGELEVTYPDGSKDVVEVPVKVGTDAEAMTPTVRPAVEVALNGKLNPADVLSSDLPKDTQLSWKTPVDTTKAGHQTGELEVTYPDGSKDVVEVPVKVGTDAEAMTPTVRPDLGVALNGELNPTDVLSSDLPKDTQLSWKTPVDTTKAGHQTGELEVTYPDGSKDVVKVPVKVGTDAEALTPTVRPDLGVALNGELNPTDVLSSDLPKETQLSWKTSVDTSKAGHQTGELEVTYPDGSKDVVEVPVKVGTDAEAMTPTVRPAVEVALNGELNPADVLSSDLPKDTQLSWKTPVDTTKAGHQTGELEVTYPDGSKDVVEVPVKVGTDAEALTPTVRPDLGVALNGELNPTDVLSSDLPKDTQLSWKTPVDTSKAGHQTGELEVTYPDGSKDVVEVLVKVGTDAEALTPTVRPDLGVALNGELNPTDVLSSDLPKETQLSWKTPVNTTKAGHQTGELEVTYPDGSKDVVKVPVKVGTDAEAMTPTVRPDLGVALNGELNPTDVLSSDLPKDTQLSWKTPVDTTKAGHQMGELEVTYPDGSKDVVKVPVKVGTDAEAMTPTVRPDLGVALNGELNPTDVLSSDLPKDTQLSWKTPMDTTKAGHQTGELEVTYPDGSKDVVEVPVKVGTDAEAMTPTVRPAVEVALNGQLTPEQVLSSELPKNTELSWKTPVDTTKAGHQTGELEVTYPDGSKDVVKVPVKVGTDAEAMTPTVRPDLGVALNGELNPTDVLSSDLPKDTQLSWKTPVDTTKAGHQTGELEVTYPDGSKEVVEVPVKVGTDAKAMTPTVRPDLGVALNGELAPTDVLSSDLPKDTQLSWKTPVDTTKAGHQTGELEVTYPDGSKDVVEVPVKVGTDAEALTPTVRLDLGVALNSELNPTDVLSSDLPKDTQLSWKTPVDTTKAGHQTGELEVTYPDGSKDVVEVPVKVGTDAEAMTPTVRPDLEVALNGELAPTDVLSSDLPKDTQLSWKTPVDTTKAGHQTGELEVTYPDGSKDVVEVPVKVGTDAEAMTPTVRPDLEVALNGELAPTDVLSSDLPKDTQLSWKTPVDTTKAGHQTGELEVTYPDGSKDVVEVPVKVGTDAEAMTPTVRPAVEVALNGQLTPEQVLISDLPKDTQLSWKTPVDTTKAGHQTGELEVTYPDGSKDVVEVPVKVGTDAEAMTPTVRPAVEVALNGQLTPEQVLSSELPKDTQLSWKTPVDTTKAGHQMGEVEVTYPDGSKDVVKVPVKVGTDAEAMTPTVRPDLEVALNGELNPTDVLLNSELPKDTELSWKKPVDTTKAGHQTGELEVTYPDGSKDVVKVPVKVGTDAEAMTPTVRPDLEVALNGELNPTDVLLNSELPKDTELSWKKPVDTTKAGHQTGELEVTYPDGSKDVVEVPVKVGTDAEAMTPTVRPAVEVALNGKLNPTDVLSSDLPKDTQLSWKKPVDTTKAGHQTGELEVTYPDGSKEVVEVSVKVGTDAEALTPTVRPDLEVALNGQLTPEQVLSSDLPKETQLSWKTPVDTTKAGHQTGELEVTYPDGSKEVVEVPVKVGTDAEALTPTVRSDLEVALNGELAPTDVLNSDLPKETQLSWKTPVDTTKAGHQTGELEVTYPDGSKDVVEVPVKVGTDAEALTPTVRPTVEVALNGELNPTDVLSSDLPKEPRLSWKTSVDTTKAGHQTGELEVTYPDGSKDVVEVPVKVGTDAEALTPTVRSGLEVALNGELALTDVLNSELPKDTQLSWKTPVDTTKAGHQMGELEVTYPDGSKDMVKVTVEVVEPPKETPVTKPVSESVDPQAKENLQVGLGETLEPTKVLDGKTLPMGTQLSWKTPVDTTKAGHQMGELEVTYPDGSKDVVKVTVEVVEPPKETPVTKPVSESVDPQAKENLQVGLGETLEPTKVLDGKTLPMGTQLSWKTPVDTTKAGYQAGELEVTYPDGSKDLVKVLVKVGTDADMYTPVGKLGVMVSLNAKVAPQQFLDTDRFPKDTQFTFEKDFDTTNSGEQKNMLKVVYPDGSYDEVVVSVKVYSEADLFTPKMRAALKVTKGTSLALDDLFDEGLPTDAQVKWLVLVDTNKVGTQTGKLEVSYRDGSKDMLNVVVDVVEADQAQRLTDVFHVNGPKEGSAVNNWKKVTGKQHTTGAKKHEEVLPQTGEHEHESTTLLGMMLLMLLGTFKFGYKKKH